MSALPTVPPVRFEDFEQMPDTDAIQELLDGCVITMPPAKKRHADLCKQIYEVLRNHVPIRRIYSETGYLIHGQWAVPDVSVAHSDQREERGYMAGAPMIAIEVASRGNTPDELEFKKELYLSHGAGEVWIVYDKTRSVVVHAGREAVSHDGLMTSRALAATINVAEFFSI